MKKTLAVLAVAVGALQAEGLTQHDRDFTMSYLHATRKQILDAVDGLSEAQWTFKAGPDRWSIAEVLEHIVLAENGLLAMTKKLAQGASSPVPEASKVKDETILKVLPQRDRKFQAAPELQPKGTLGTGAPEIAAFKQARDATIQYIRTTDADLREHSSPSPLGQLDCVQWLLFMSAHSERHMNQILEVKADPKFPH